MKSNKAHRFHGYAHSLLHRVIHRKCEQRKFVFHHRWLGAYLQITHSVSEVSSFYLLIAGHIWRVPHTWGLSGTLTQEPESILLALSCLPMALPTARSPRLPAARPRICFRDDSTRSDPSHFTVDSVRIPKLGVAVGSIGRRSSKGSNADPWRCDALARGTRRVRGRDERCAMVITSRARPRGFGFVFRCRI